MFPCLFSEIIFIIVAGNELELTQLSAAKQQEDDVFNVYILPSQPISQHIVDLTGLSVQRQNGERVLTHNGVVVESVSAKQALEQFCDWLPRRSVLFAHNGKAFDIPHLIRVSNENGVQLSQKVVCMGDTLPVTKEVFPEERSYSQETLCKQLLDLTYKAHDSSEDACALKKLAEHTITSSKDANLLLKHCFTFSSCAADARYKTQQNDNFKTLIGLVSGKIISKSMGQKIAGSGLQYGHLKCAYERSGIDGLTALFKSKTEKGPRVTNMQRIILSVSDHFEGASRKDASETETGNSNTLE